MALGGRAWTWLIYLPCTAASVLFAIVGLVTFGDLAQVQYDDSAGHLGSQLNGAMAATFMAPVITGGLLVMSFFLLIKKSWTRSGAGFSYGWLTSWYAMNSMLVLLTGIVLTANKHWTSTFQSSIKGIWTKSATNAYVATYILAFISCAFQLVMAATLISNRKSFGGAQLTVDELGLSDRLRGPSSSGIPEAGSPASPEFTQPVPATGSARTGAWSTGV
ncbi:flagellar associated [Chlorella sorokiniana]|uniref:Flagellar associated n=1 Tax=Chlorella sorokiniana TaxID=3076 RepID=A0A2P6TXZ1_CHLSO|nr:flagellar associated [Chlorella sorokiniana]|eukprot:PRW58937.1 flagellar associated [Chlorella sorokiniana]